MQQVWVPKEDLVKYPQGGYFSARTDESVTIHSGYIVFDVDKIQDPVGFREMLRQNPYIYAAWVSPSGDGVNFLVRIPADVTAHTDLYVSFIIANKQLGLDTTSKNIARVKYESYDPDLWTNPEAQVWTTIVKPPEKKAPPPPKREVKNLSKVNKLLRKIQYAADGEKHDVLRNVSIVFGGYAAGKLITWEYAQHLLQAEISKKEGVLDLQLAFKTIEDGMRYGYDKPLTSFGEAEVLNMKVGSERLYLHGSEIYGKIVEFYEKGYPRGVDLGWMCMVDYITLLKGTVTYGYGAPYSGKSQWFHEAAVNCAVYYDWKIAIMSPETGEAHHIYGELISILVGKSFVGDFKMERDKMEAAANFIMNHFYVIEPNGREMTMVDFFNQVETMEREFGIHIDMTIIDPFNYISQDLKRFGGREDHAVGKDLEFMLHDAKYNDRHNVLITHIRDQKQPVKTKEGQYFYPPATFRDIAQGQIFSRKGMQMLCFYRPLDTKGNPLLDEHGMPFEKNTTQIFVQKSKPKGVGKVGLVQLYYDWQRNQYYELMGGQTIFSRKTKYSDINEQVISDTEDVAYYEELQAEIDLTGVEEFDDI
jgi:hypothetical protein